MSELNNENKSESFSKDVELNIDNYHKSTQHALSKHSPFQLLQMLTQLPPTKPTFKSTEEAIVDIPKSTLLPTFSLPKIEPYIRKPKTLSNQLLDSHTKKKFSEHDLEIAEKKRLEINFFKRKHRHIEDVDETLSIISARSTKSYSRFDRVMEPSPKRISTQELISQDSGPDDFILSTPERVTIQKQLDSIVGIQTQKQTQEQTHFKLQIQSQVLLPTQSEQELIETYSINEEKKDEIEDKDNEMNLVHNREELNKTIISTQNIEEPNQLIFSTQETEESEKSLPEMMDTMSIGENKESTPDMIDFDDDIDYGLDEPSDNFSEEKIKSNRRIVVQGDSFIKKKMNEPVTRTKKRLMIPHVKAKSIFQSNLSHTKRLTTSIDLSRATSLFCDQLVDDLKSYKNNQPKEDQNEITDKDVILLMQRQRLIHDKSSLESLAQRYLPREYIDIVCQSALAFNELYPGFNQKYQDDFYYYNYDNEKDEDE